jgi:hypothetical protein
MSPKFLYQDYKAEVLLIDIKKPAQEIAESIRKELGP